jgi:SAM-dependent methyltransferase
MRAHDSTAPSEWLVRNQHLLPTAARALDVACGGGRNALWLAAHGFETTAIDRDPVAIDALAVRARTKRLPLTALAMDLEAAGVTMGLSVYDVVVVVHYLHRPLFPALLAALRPGGVLVYETFTVAQAARGRPTNPAFLLEPGELARLVSPLEILAAREGDYEGRMVSSVVARAPLDAVSQNASRSRVPPRRP